MNLTIPRILALLRENLRVQAELVTELGRILVGEENGAADLDYLVRHAPPNPNAVVRAGGQVDGRSLRALTPEERIKRRRERAARYRERLPTNFYSRASREKRHQERMKLLARFPKIFTGEHLGRVGLNKIQRARWIGQSVHSGLIRVLEPGKYERFQ
jgi:hypothetical protein